MSNKCDECKEQALEYQGEVTKHVVYTILGVITFFGAASIPAAELPILIRIGYDIESIFKNLEKAEKAKQD